MKREDERINVWGARVHNLKNIDVEIPRNTLTVITGLSGSGNHHSPSTPSLPKDNGDTSRHSRPMHGISSEAWSALT